MDARKVWIPPLLILASGSFVILSLTYGQERTIQLAPEPGKSAAQPEGATRARDLSKLPPLQQQMYLSAQRGGDWLRRANRTDGRFVHGYLPDLKAPLEGDHYLRQAGAAYALSRVAHFLGEERYIAVARQAVLTLLVDTTMDPKDSQVRTTSLPAAVVNRLGAAGLLILAINELPSPGEDLLEQSEQLCAFIRKQQAADGSLNCFETDGRADADPEAINHFPGEALYGIMGSQRYRPAAWKTDLVRKALPYYRAWWSAHQSMAFVPWQSAAYVEACLLTKEKPFADFAYEMNDWLCGLQYVQLDPRHPLWTGGFMEWLDGKAIATMPQASSAFYAESLAEACRLAQSRRDEAQYLRYREALERCLQFVNTLQYTDANTQHFADWYRPVLLGAFHASQQDGNLRIDYTQHAVCALVQYLQVNAGW